MTVVEAKEIAKALGVEVAEVLAHFGGANVVPGPGMSGLSAGNVSQGQGAAAAVAAREWEAEFMRRWVDLGMMLMRRPG